jgi:hypothetical protein
LKEKSKKFIQTNNNKNNKYTFSFSFPPKITKQIRFSARTRMVKSPSQTPPPSPPPSPQPQPPQFHHLQSATDIIRLMTKDLPRPISPLHSSYLELSEKSPPEVTVHPPPPQSLLHPSLSATDIVDKMTQELSEESPPAVTVHPPPPSPPSGQLPPPENWSPEEERYRSC